MAASLRAPPNSTATWQRAVQVLVKRSEQSCRGHMLRIRAVKSTFADAQKRPSIPMGMPSDSRLTSSVRYSVNQCWALVVCLQWILQCGGFVCEGKGPWLRLAECDGCVCAQSATCLVHSSAALKTMSMVSGCKGCIANYAKCIFSAGSEYWISQCSSLQHSWVSLPAFIAHSAIR